MDQTVIPILSQIIRDAQDCRDNMEYVYTMMRSAGNPDMFPAASLRTGLAPLNGKLLNLEADLKKLFKLLSAPAAPQPTEAA